LAKRSQLAKFYDSFPGKGTDTTAQATGDPGPARGGCGRV